MHASLARRQLGGLVPPKIATPKLLIESRRSSVTKILPSHLLFPVYDVVPQSGRPGPGGGGLAPLVEFYSKLPKGPAPVSSSYGIKGRYFEGANASGKPLVFAILAIFGLGYTIDYNMHLKHHKNRAH